MNFSGVRTLRQTQTEIPLTLVHSNKISYIRRDILVHHEMPSISKALLVTVLFQREVIVRQQIATTE